jgi:hypothetical protein
MPSFDERLDRVQLIFAPVGCPTCRSWSRSVLAYEDQFGNVVRDRPAACPTCGRVLPYERVVVLVDVDDEVRR